MKQPPILPNKQQSPVNISFFAWLSDLAYLPASTIRQNLVSRDIGYDVALECFEDSTLATQGFGLNFQDHIILCFRGTEPAELIDWITDLDFLQDPVNLHGHTYMVHGGFWQALENVWPHIKGWLNVQSPHKKIWLTGHSLGGALACLALVKLISDKFTDQFGGLYTFGSPRNVNSALAKN